MHEPLPTVTRPRREAHARSGSPQLWALRAAFRTLGTLAPGVAARWAESLFRRPPRHESHPREEAFLATGRRFGVRSGPHALAAWEWGSGPTVLLVHGWGSRAGRLGALARAVQAAGFRLVAYDAPGHGASSGRYSSLPEFAAALEAVAHAVGPIHAVVGHSLGGAAASLAMGRGLTPNRAVLFAAPADVVMFYQAFAQHLRIPRRCHEAMRRNLEVRFVMRWEDLHVPSIAQRLRVPLLVFHDRHDPDVPLRHAEEIVQAWPDARLVVTTGLGHRAILRDPEVIRQAVTFLAG